MPRKSNDAANALGMLAGAPGALNVTALRRQEVPIADETPMLAEGPASPLEAPETIETATLNDPVELASAALDAASVTPPPAKPANTVTNVVPTSAPVTSAPAATPPTGYQLDKPFVQIGLFSVEDNANRNGTALRNAGIVPAILKEESNGKVYWRVLAGPAPNNAESKALLAKVKKLGYSDAYFVKN